MKQTTSWGKVADWYDDYLKDPDSYQSQVILPNLLRISDPKAGSSILDLACGQGFFSFQMAKKGAKVVGVDISKELIQIAVTQAKKEKVAVDFYVSSAHKLSIIKDKVCDTIVCVLAAQNIKELDQMLGECKRILKPKGRIIFVLNHPAFRIPQESDWYFNEDKKKQGRVVYTYLSEKQFEIEMNPGKTNSAKTISFHRPLQVYVKWLSKHGFAVTRLEEWISHKKSQKGTRSLAEDSARHEIPLFMCLEGTFI